MTLVRCPQLANFLFLAKYIDTLIKFSFHFIFTGLDLESGIRYIVIVKAVNFAGLQVEAASDGFTVDFTPPKTRDAIIGTGLEPAEYQSDVTKVTIRYGTVFP